jgi:hypothetical protein
VAKGWTLQLGAHTGNLHDTNNYIGASSDVTDGYNSLSVPKPPVSSPYVQLAISHTDWNRRSGLYARDIRSGSGSKQWGVAVSTDQPHSDVTISWNSAVVPRNVRLILTDVATGTVTDMRSRAAYTFNTGANAGPRNFTVAAGTATYAPSTVTNVGVRNVGRAGGAMAIDFTLSGDASYEVKILNATGASIATVATRAVTSGSVSLVWNGRAASGVPVPTGTYLVQIRATNSGGDTVRALRPFTIVR